MVTNGLPLYLSCNLDTKSPFFQSSTKITPYHLDKTSHIIFIGVSFSLYAGIINTVSTLAKSPTELVIDNSLII